MRNGRTFFHFYHWGIDCGADQLVETLGKTFRGDIQCDGYRAFKTHAKASSVRKALANDLRH